MSKDDITTYMREHVGQPFRIDQLTADVHALWDSGFFDDVEVDLERRDEGVTLRFIVRERPNIKSIEFSGNDEIENDKLLEAIEIKPNTILSVPAVRRSVQKIKDAYAEKGYFLADCEFKVEPQRDNEVIVRFKITEHQPVTVRRVTFIGNLHVPDDELRDMMQTGNGGFLAFGSGGPYRQDVFERDILQINALYYDKGFMSVQIGTPRVMLTPDREGIEITVVIHEGPRFKIRQLKIFERDDDGHEVEPIGGRRALVQMLHAHSGDYFNRAELVKDLQDVRALYRDHGYANVEADPQTELDPVHQEVDIVIPIRRGSLVSVERIEIKGNTKTRDKILRREMEIQEGQLFSESKLEHSKRRITALGYFERVDVSTEQGSTPDKIIINFEITEKPTGTFQVGAGFSSVENFIATAQVQQANLFGNGQSLALQAQVSGLRQLVSLRFFEPYFLDTDWSFSTELFDTLYVFPDFSRRSLGGSVTYGYALIQPWLRLSLTGTVESDQVSTAQVSTFFGATPGYISIFQRLPLANLFNDGLTVSIRPSLVYDTRDNRLFPSSGVYLQGSTELASDYLGLGDPVSAPPPDGALLLQPRRGLGRAGDRLHPQAEYRVRLHLEPQRGGRPDLHSVLPRRHPRRPRLPAAVHRRAPAAEPVARPERAADRERGEHRRQPRGLRELRVRVPAHRQGRHPRRHVLRRRERLEHREPVLQDDPRAAVLERGESVLRDGVPVRPQLGRLRHPLVLPAGPAPLRVGLSARAAQLRAALGVRVHDRELLLTGHGRLRARQCGRSGGSLRTSPVVSRDHLLAGYPRDQRLLVCRGPPCFVCRDHFGQRAGRRAPRGPQGWHRRFRAHGHG